MAQAIVNLALPVITNKVEEVLQTYPVSPHQQVFAVPSLRDQLVAYVVRRMPALYTTAEETTACSVDSPANCYSREQQSQMDALIREGVRHLMEQQHHCWETAAQESSMAGSPAPSHWFG